MVMPLKEGVTPLIEGQEVWGQALERLHLLGQESFIQAGASGSEAAGGFESSEIS